MKKNIILAFFLSLFLILSGCGSNDKVDAGTRIESKKVATLQSAPIVPNGLNFSLVIPVIKSISSKYTVTMDNFNFIVMGCELENNSIRVPSSIVLNGDIGSTGNIEISGKFQSSNCIPTGYRLTYNQTITDGSRSRTDAMTFEGSTSSAGDGTSGDSGYYFYNKNTPIKISVPNKKYDIKIQLAKDSFVVAGKMIKIKAFSNTFGDLKSYEAITGIDGYAVFEYNSPDPLPGNGISAILTAEFSDSNNATIETGLVLTFDLNGSSVIDINTTLPIAIVPQEKRTVTLVNNGQNIDIAIKVFKDTAPYTSGDVKVELPSEVLEGVDVGSFESYSVAVNPQGVALFHYTGPNNLKALIDSNYLGSTFKFYHENNSAPESRQPMNVVYQPGDNYVPIDYRLIIATENNDYSMGIPELTKTLNVVLQKIDGSNLDANDATITGVTVQVENASVAQIYDTASGSLVNRLSLQSINNSSFILKSKKLSGIVPIRAKIEFDDANDDHKILETIINVRVMSGPPSAISISYVSTEQDKSSAKYIEKFAITVVDEYGNKVNTKPYISLGALAGYTVDGRETSSVESNETKRLFYGRSDIVNSIANGYLDNQSDADPSTTHFEELMRADTFKYVNSEGANTDKLVVFGSGKNYEAMGKWDFEKIDNTTLKLQDDYFGVDRDGLSYAIGRNYYQDQCRQDGREWTGSASSDTYQIDDQGTVVVDYRYDYHLSGKDVMVWVNLDGIQPDTGKKTRIGEAIKHTLRTTGLIAVPESYTLEQNSFAVVTFMIHHENAPEWYRNAHFGALPLEGSNCGNRVISTSNYFDARTCNNVVYADSDNNSLTQDTPEHYMSLGVSYVTYEIWSTPDKGCSFGLERIVTSREF